VHGGTRPRQAVWKRGSPGGSRATPGDIVVIEFFFACLDVSGL